MTKASNIKRKRAQRGRPRDENAEREPNGRRRRALHPRQQEDARVVAIEARMRHCDLPETFKLESGKILDRLEIAAMQDAGSILGVLHVQGRITKAMKEAGELVEEYHRDKERATQTPDSLATRGAGTGGDLVSNDYISWAIAAVAKWEVAKDWLTTASALKVFEHCVVGRNYPTDEEYGSLYIGLSYLAVCMGLDRRQKPT